MRATGLERAAVRIVEIRVQMAEQGWKSEDRLTDVGWGNGFGYSVWFRRWDWHGTHLIKAIGEDACYHAHRKGLDRGSMLVAVEEAAQRARDAWNRYPYPALPPVQMADGKLRGR